MVNIILSRKGFDRSAGGCASPILPDGKTMVSLPIPDDRYSQWRYEDLTEPVTGKNYHQLIGELRPGSAESLDLCHLDPDINPKLHQENDWSPIFGQEGAAEGVLENNSVSVGDIFLYFGWYKGTVEKDGRLRYATKRDGGDFFHYSHLHMIFGYLEVKEIVKDPEEMQTRFPWHPHARRHELFRNNTMYIGDRKSSRVFDFDEKRILTRRNRSRAKWDAEKLSWMKGASLSMRPKYIEDYLIFDGRWQELVIRDAKEDGLDWLSEILK